MTKTEFIEQMKILSMAYSNDFDLNKLSLWYENLNDIDYKTFKETVKEIIKIKKYMPTISELIEQSNLIKEKTMFKALEQMKKDNYFADEWEYDKAVKFLENNNVPQWFLEEMKKYNKILLENTNKVLTN